MLVSIRSQLTDILTRVEAAIDFPEDVDELIEPGGTAKIVQKEAVEPLKRLIRYYIDAHIFRDGLTVAIVGRPNAGKSSLLNQLVKKDRAIVTPHTGNHPGYHRRNFKHRGHTGDCKRHSRSS